MNRTIEYSIVVFDSLEKVRQIMTKFKVELVPNDFCGEDGFTFSIEDDENKIKSLIEELDSLGTVYLSRKYGVMSSDVK